MSGADRFVSMALDDVIKYRRKEGGGRGFRRGGRGQRGGQNMMPQRGGRGGGMRGQRGFPQRIPGGRIAKNRMPNQGPHQHMPNFRGGRGGPFPRGGFVQRGHGNMQPPHMPPFNPHFGFTTGHNHNNGGRMRAWNNEEPEQYAMPSNTIPMRGRGRGGPRGAMRGMRGGRGGGMPSNRPVRMQRPPQFYPQPQMMHPPMHQQQYEHEELPPQQPRVPKMTQAKKTQINLQLKANQQAAKNRVRLATQVLMQRKRQLEQVNEANAAIQRQAGLKTRGLQLRGGAVQRVTGLGRGGGIIKRPIDARQAIRQKIVRASVNRQRAVQQAQNAPMHVNIPNTRMQQQRMQQPRMQQPRMQQMRMQQQPHMQQPHMMQGPPRPMPNRGLAAASVRRAANFRRTQMAQGAKQLMRNAKQLTLHERFSNQY